MRQVGGFSPGTPVSSTNKTDGYDIAETLLTVVLNTITPNPIYAWQLAGHVKYELLFNCFYCTH